ncbi:MAG: WYL domain-containing protein [bacterium]|nr:WYL domain-containing protein [bacterium]
MSRPLVVLDCEKAALEGAPHLLELAAVRVEGGEVQETFEELVCPPVPIEPEATDIHGITEDDVRNADPAFAVLGRFRRFVGGDWMAAHNAGADASILGFEHARAALEPPPGPILCSLRLAVEFLPEAPDHKLPTLAQHLELEDAGSHRALADAVICWKVLEACIERLGGSGSLPDLLARSRNPVTIPSSLPDPARMSPRLRPLEPAIAAGAQVRLLYGEDGEVPVPLSVLPLFLFKRHKKSYLEAECLQSGLLKTYRLDRVRKVLDG